MTTRTKTIDKAQRLTDGPACASTDKDRVTLLAPMFDSLHKQDHYYARTFYCNRCPIVQECLQLALAEHERHKDHPSWRSGPYGTWGGLLWRNGEIIGG